MRLRECEQSCRELNAVLQKIHTSGGIEKIPQLIKEIRGIFERSVRPQVAALFEAVPGGQPQPPPRTPKRPSPEAAQPQAAQGSRQ